MSRRPRVNDRGGKGKGKPTEEEAGRDFSVSVEGEGGSVGTGRSDGKRSRGGRQRGRGRGRGGRGRNGESHSTEHEQAERASLVEQGGNRRGGRRQRPSRGRGKSNFVPELKWKLVGLGPSDVHDLAGLSVVEEIVERVGKDIKAFVHTINNIVLPRGAKLMKDVLKIISMLASSLSVQTLDAEDTTRDEACVVLGEVLSDRCAPFHMQLHHFIVEGPERHVMQQLCNTFRTLLESLPESSWGCLPVDVLKDTIERSECDTDSVLRQSICEVAELKDNITEQRRLKNENKATKGNCEITWDNSEYREIPLLPTWGEVCINKVPAKLRPNIIKGEYENWMHYYDVHFRLLREDFIAPLRRGICDYLDGMNGRQLRDVKVYSSVKVLEPQFTYAGVSYRVHFDTSRLKRYRWEHSKRLLFGSLLCLSPDDFRNVVLFATVSDRKPEELKKGFVSLQFEEGADLQYIFDPKAVFVMVESNAFFEASRHVLRSLQTAEVETMPFTRYIIKCDSKSVNAPKYLDATNCSYNLSCLYGSTESSKQPLMINILDRQQWPVARRVELDQSQLDAIQQALTQEVAIIQGPPGTGKTYIGLKIVEALLRNRKVWDSCGQSPILVMCYTNHALDQFLQGILSIRLPEEVNEDEDEDDLIKRLRKASIEPLKSVVPTIVRVGGRCQNEAINEFNVEKLVRKVYIPSEIRQKYNRCRDKLNMFHHAADMKALKTFFEPNNHSFLKLSELSELVDDPDLVYQLSQLARTEDDHGYEVELWLGLWDQVELTATKDGRIFSENIIDPTYHVIKKYNKTEDTQPELNSYDNDADDDEVSFLQNSGLGTGDMMSSGTAASKNDGHINDEKDAVESNMDELIDVQGEAEIEESSRVLTEDIEDYQPVDFEKAAENVHTLCTVMNLPEEKVDLLAYGDETISSNDGNDGNAVKATDDDIQGSLTAQEDDDDAQVIEDAENTDDEVQDDLITDMKDIRAEMYQKTIVWRPKVDAGKNITKYLSKTTMSQSQAKAVKNIFALEPQQKWQLYNYWVMKKYQNMVGKNKWSFDEYTKQCEECKVAKQASHRYVFESSDVIGLTTTGAAKHQHIIHMVKPKIVIIEEAAEVLESHIVSALSAGTQHLILIGDHKQLRPKPNEYELVKKYNLDISLFERLVQHQLPHATLNIQHRMRPEIAQLVHPHIYEVLHNHESVLKYDHVKGVFRNMFFIDHEYPEESEDNLMSHANQHEAEFTVALCKYLLQQGYDGSQITILTPYTGQLLKLKALMPKAVFFGVRATAVDNFQGEENDIILLSLVRSNKEGQLGFLKEPNRVCVSLSRAKKGFYCIGNFKMLRANAPIWDNIMSDMESKGYYGDGIQLQCQIHAKSTFIARLPSDFANYAPEGGCTLPCNYRLQCGHTCISRCHLKDQKHENYECKQPCARHCSRGHNCKQLCFSKCPPCKEKVMITVSSCGHLQQMLCHEDPDKLLCQAPCEKLCERGHPCKKRCNKACRCDVLVIKEVPKCKHTMEIPCYLDPNAYSCKFPLIVLCAKQLHMLDQLCGSTKQVCNTLVEKCIPSCRHKHLMPCSLDPAVFSCTSPCEKWMRCFRHKCPMLCGEPCPSRCEIIVEKTELCGHTMTVPCYMSQTTLQCTQKCTKTLPCGHKCSETCNVPCTVKCQNHVTSDQPCGHRITQKCYVTRILGLSRCEKQLKKQLTCGHSCLIKCHESERNIKCKEEVLRTYPCNHTAKLLCHQSPDPFKCKDKCQEILVCGHQCSGVCGQCNGRHMHQTCPYDVKLIRYCGHTVSTRCNGLNDTCSMDYTFSCPHSTVSLKCPEPFPLCTKPCTWVCPHYHCDKKCSELCNRPRCDERCGKLLNCGHRCHGVCGEPCLTICLDCNEKEFKKHLCGIKKKSKIPKELKYIQQKLCGHIHTVEYMDNYVDSNASAVIRPIKCPENGCIGLIEIGFRYGNAQRLCLENVRRIAEDIMREDVQCMYTLLDEVLSSKPIPMTHNMAIVEAIENYKENLLGVGKDEAQLMHLLLQANNVIEYAERNSISVNLKQFAATCSTLKELARTTNSLKYQMSQQLIDDFSSELYKILLQTHCIQAKTQLTFKRSESSAVKLAKMHITPVEDTLDALDNKRLLEGVFKKHRETLQKIYPIDVVISHSKVFSTRCHWYKCPKGHGYYSAGPKVENATCPLCDSK